jgi:hypothetical protein
VLVAGGIGIGGDLLSSAELYDPASGSWSVTGSLNTARAAHTATLLPNGKVLVAGGYNGSNLTSAELYDPASGSWSATGSLNTGRYQHTATLLSNGKVLVAGGYGGGDLSSAELYDTGLGFVRPDWQPQIATATSPLALGSSLVLTGSRFQGISQASGGNFQDSSTNYPIVQLRDIDNSQVVFLPVDPTAGWSNTAFTSTLVNNFPPGPALVTVFTNGIPSDAKYVLVYSQYAPTVMSAVSRKTHGGAGIFDITMPLTGSSGVECRTTGGTNDYTLVVTFAGNVTVTGSPQAQVTSGTGCVGTGGVCTGNVSVSGAVVTVPLTNIANAQVINVRINGVNSASDRPAVDVNIPMGILWGDTSGNRAVNSADIAQTKGRTGQPVHATNFRSDVNASGSINAGDIVIVKQNSGRSLPP